MTSLAAGCERVRKRVLRHRDVTLNGARVLPYREKSSGRSELVMRIGFYP